MEPVRPASPAPPEEDRPRTIDPGRAPIDSAFRAIVAGVAALVLAVFGSIGVFLFLKSFPTFRNYGFGFFTEIRWNPESNTVGVAAALIGTIEVALVALVVAFPLALGVALFISEYAPRQIKGALVSMIDLMAAVPSIIYGLWGASQLQDHSKFVARWLNQYLGWIPIFRVDTDPNAAVWAQTRFTTSMFIAGLAVAMMVIPIACSVMRGVFGAAPIGEREAAYALGATRWGMVRTVVLPFGRGGIVGGTMLGLGRALGETIAVLMILSLHFDDLNLRILQTGGDTISGLIANRFGDATSLQLSALLTAGLVLFVVTLMVNSAAGVIVSRSRSGAATEI
ncbi:MAG: phosphate transport system permease protein [Pseudonocardiales bacterium]|jgi:phosphate transport system permease protein|nr:phosphate transport system permease protein [Pseudonocardiales bacterium]